MMLDDVKEGYNTFTRFFFVLYLCCGQLLLVTYGPKVIIYIFFLTYE